MIPNFILFLKPKNWSFFAGPFMKTNGSLKVQKWEKMGMGIRV
jgi:hypothetical protein